LKKLLVLTAILLLLLVVEAEATRYYIDNFGSDSANGLSISTPWRSLIHASTQSYNAGDTILIMGGDYTERNWWNDSESNDNNLPSGTSGSPVVVMAYGDSVAVFKLMDYDDDGIGPSDRWRNIYFGDINTISNCQYFHLSGYSWLDVDGDSAVIDSFQIKLEAWEASRGLIKFSNPNVAHIKIHGVEVDGSNDPFYIDGVEDIAGDYVETGIYFLDAAQCTIQNNYVHHIVHPTGSVSPGTGQAEFCDGDTGEHQGCGFGMWIDDCNRMYIKGNIIKHVNHGCIEFPRTTYSKIIDNVLEQHSGGGIYLTFNPSYNLIEGNIITRCGETTKFQKPGIQLSGSHNTIRNNVIYNPHNQVFTLEASSGATVEHNLIYNNTFCYGWYSVNWLQHSGYSNRFNTFSNNICAYSDSIGQDMPDPCGAIVFETYWASAAYTWLDVCDGDDEWTDPADINWGSNTVTYNRLYRADHPETTIVYVRENRCNGEEHRWKSSDLTSYLVGNTDGIPGIVSTDPDAYGLAAGWWYLDSGSPCVDAGTEVTDVIGSTVEALYTGYGWSDLSFSGEAPDIGAHELGATAGDTCCITQGIAFGSQHIDSGSVIDSFLIYNCGDSALVDSFDWTPTLFTIEDGDSTLNIPAGDSLWVSVGFDPSTLTTAIETLVVDLNFGICNDVILSGIGEGDIGCSIMDTIWAFGDVNQDAYKIDTSFVYNTADSAVAGTMNFAAVAPDNWTLLEPSGGVYDIAAGDSQMVRVIFAPTGAEVCSFVVDMGEAACSDMTVTGTGLGECCLVSGSMSFGVNDIGVAHTDSFSIYNCGNQNIVDTVHWWAVPTEFVLLSDSFYTLTPGQTKFIAITYTATAVGLQQKVLDTGSSLCADITISGQGYNATAPPGVLGSITPWRMGGETYAISTGMYEDIVDNTTDTDYDFLDEDGDHFRAKKIVVTTGTNMPGYVIIRRYRYQWNYNNKIWIDVAPEGIRIYGGGRFESEVACDGVRIIKDYTTWLWPGVRVEATR